MGSGATLHPTDQTLQAYRLGTLDDQTAVAVSDHLDSCPDCQSRVANISGNDFAAHLREPPERSRPTPVRWPQARSSSVAGDSSTGAPPASETLPPGLADHPDYEIKRELGRGGMGIVYLAHNKLMGRDEVLKVMGRHVMERPGVFERFLREIRAVARLRHPNIVTAYHATRIGESIVFAMEYVEGLDLSRMVKAKGPLPVAHACNFAYQAALGLQHAHEEGLVHRDIKPGNLMLARKGDKATIKVLDFGLAKATREDKVDVGLTSEGQALGTPDYIAPEQILDAPSADIRADIYSLGATLYYLLTGRPPFKTTSLYDMYQAHISRDADRLNLVRTEVAAELAALVAKMMAKEPARRFQTPAEVARALAPFFQKGQAVSRTSETGVSRSTNFEPQTAPAKTGSSPSRPAIAPATDPAIPPRVVAAPAGQGLPPLWNSLIGAAPPPLPAQSALRSLIRRRRWLLPATIAGVISVALLAGWLVGALVGRGYVPRFDAKGQDSGRAADRQRQLDKYLSLFNGEDLSGWEDILPNESEWKVVDGIIEGHGGGERGTPGVLLTDRRDFTDFSLRVTLRYLSTGRGRIEIRHTGDNDEMSGYQVLCAPANGVPAASVGRAREPRYGAALDFLKRATPIPLQVDQWYTIEIKARGNRIVTSLNDTTVLDFTDAENSYKSGGIAMICAFDSKVQIREITIKELVSPVPSREVAENDPGREMGESEPPQKEVQSREDAKSDDGLSAVGRWLHSPPGGGGEITLKPDGTIEVNGTTAGSWTQDGSSLTLTWPNADAPDGAWCDRCELSADGMRYKGQNQQGAPISGSKVTE